MKKFWEAFKEEVRTNGVRTFLDTAKTVGPPSLIGAFYGFVAGKMGLSTTTTLISIVVLFGLYAWSRKAIAKIRSSDEP